MQMNIFKMVMTCYIFCVLVKDSPRSHVRLLQSVPVNDKLDRCSANETAC